MLTRAEGEYRLALKFNPNAANTYIALADVSTVQHKYQKSAETLQAGLAVAPNDPMISAQLARSYAQAAPPVRSHAGDRDRRASRRQGLQGIACDC